MQVPLAKTENLHKGDTVWPAFNDGKPAVLTTDPDGSGSVCWIDSEGVEVAGSVVMLQDAPADPS